VSGLLQGVAVLLGVAYAGFAVMALVAGYRAVRIAGWSMLLDGMGWITKWDRVPGEAKPHLRLALARFGWAALCFVLAAVAGAASGTLA
jgi:hypothetical protein